MHSIRPELGGRPLRALAFVGLLVAVPGCATPLARPGHALRVTTVDGDTLYGKLVVTGPEGMILSLADGDSTQVSMASVEQIDVDRTRLHWWSGTAASCVMAATGVVMTSTAGAKEGNWRMIPGIVLTGTHAWECLDLRPRWKRARASRGRRSDESSLSEERPHAPLRIHGPIRHARIDRVGPGGRPYR